MITFADLTHLVATPYHKILSAPPTGGLEGYLTAGDIASIAATEHDHDGVYAAALHDHDGVYAATEHDHEEFLTQSEIEALPGFGGAASNVCTVSYVGNGTQPRNIAFPGDFTFCGMWAAKGATGLVYYFASQYCGGYLTSTGTSMSAGWCVNPISAGIFEIPISNAVHNVSGVVYNAIIWGVVV